MTEQTNDEARATLADYADRKADRIARVAAAYFGSSQQPIERIGEIIATIDKALSGNGADVSAGPKTPAVPIKKSVGDDFIICLEDGKKLTMLKRYLRSQYNLSPEEYRAKWGLPHDYPMVAPAYARVRSAFAKKIGLGTVPVSGSKRGSKKK